MLDKIKETLSINRKVNEERKAQSLISEKYIEEQNRLLNMKDNYLEEIVKQAQNGSDAGLKLFVDFCVKVKVSFSDIKVFMKYRNIPYTEDILSSHYIMGSIQVIDDHEWKDSENTYFIVGNMGSGKSSFIQYLKKNIKAHQVVSLNKWTVNVRNNIEPEVSCEYVKAKTIVPWHYEVKLK
jgi:polynucleotide 5'-kinase involved in rRNA processing